MPYRAERAATHRQADPPEFEGSLTIDVPASYDGALERTADGGIIRFERHLPYPVRDVWDRDGFAEAQAHYASIGLAPPVDAS